MNKKVVVSDIFSQLYCIPYIVPRGYDFIPKEVSIKNDIDLLMQRKNRNHIISLFKKKGFQKKTDSKTFYTYLYGTHPHDHFISKRFDLHFDIIYNFSYRSINNGEWVPAHKEIQISAWDNRLHAPKTIWKYQLAPTDEFIHLIAHCVFDKRKFSNKHVTQIKRLNPHIDPDKARHLLRHLFFNFTDQLLNHIESNHFSAIFDDYISFSEY